MIVPRVIRDEYDNHDIFATLDKIVHFYFMLSQNTIGWVSTGIMSEISPDTYVFGSICGTVESIKQLSAGGRIADAFTLLRKYHDATIINKKAKKR